MHNFVRVRVMVRVMVTGAKHVGKNVVGHDVLGQEDGNQSLTLTRLPLIDIYCYLNSKWFVKRYGSILK